MSFRRACHFSSCWVCFSAGLEGHTLDSCPIGHGSSLAGNAAYQDCAPSRSVADHSLHSHSLHSPSLQATHCTATRCTATRCNATRCTATRCNATRCTATCCTASRCTASRCTASRCTATHRAISQYANATAQSMLACLHQSLHNAVRVALPACILQPSICQPNQCIAGLEMPSHRVWYLSCCCLRYVQCCLAL